MRIGFYRLMILGCFGLLACALFFVQVVRGRHYYALSRRNSIRLVSEEPCRGRILDRNGMALADNILSFDVIAVAQELKDKDAAFKKVSHVLALNETAVTAAFERGYLNPVTPVILAKALAKTTAIAVEEAASDIAGIRVELNPRRFYPYGATASHVLGTIGEIDRSRITRLKEYGYDLKDLIGTSGLEERLDGYLRGEKGGQQIEVDSRGRQVRLLGYKPPRSGGDVVTTIDLELQQIADTALAASGYRGAVVVMGAGTGEVFVMSSAPAFDPNVFVDRKEKKSLETYLTSKEAPLFNRAASGAFPPGSVFKVVTAVSALSVKKFNPTMTYVCTGKLRIGDRYFKCWSTHGAQDFNQAMAHSCDIYFYRLGLAAGADAMHETARAFGLAEPTGVDVSGEASGFIPCRLWKRLKYLDSWYDGDTANFSIGQGYVLVTPLQLARMMAAVGNGGLLVTPSLVKKIGGRQVPLNEPRAIRVSADALRMVKEALRYPVSLPGGTAHDLDIEGLNICAKTGTAQISGSVSHGWVAGFFPQENPQYAFCILLENAGTSHAACALGRQIFQEAARRKKLL